MTTRPERSGDPLGRGLELGLAATVILAPLPLAAVGPRGRLGLEIGAALVGVLWLGRAWVRDSPWPPRAVRLGVFGLVTLAALQIVPLPAPVVARIAPGAERIRRESRPPPVARAAEARLLGTDPGQFDPGSTLSVDPAATASALRTGVALALLLVAAYAVAARGGRTLAAALLVSAAFQGLYGVLALGAGSERIWNVPRRWVFDAATGTFVNPNHYAAFLAMALPAGVALLARGAARPAVGDARTRLIAFFSGRGSRAILVGLLLVIGLAGLLTSFSRSGIALGLAAVGATGWLAGRRHPVRARAVAIALVVATAALPLAQIGLERLAERYLDSARGLTAPGGRLRVWRDTAGIVGAFPVAGSGFGTFVAIYPVFRSAEVRLLYNHAHNDALQFLAEGGLVGGALLALLLVPLVRAMLAALGGAKGTLGVGFAAGLGAMVLLSLLEFDFHIPANAATAAILAGTLLGLPCSARN